ncbi:MAG: divalent-cation tolerance protein CutA [Aureliella sp.]
MTQVLEIVTTTEDHSQAKALANSLIEKRLAACVQIDGPMQSVYYWDGEVKHEAEFRITIKTTSDRADGIQELFQKQHPYDLPQWIERPAYQSERGSAYATWVKQQVKQ